MPSAEEEKGRNSRQKMVKIMSRLYCNEPCGIGIPVTGGDGRCDGTQRGNMLGEGGGGKGCGGRTQQQQQWQQEQSNDCSNGSNKSNDCGNGSNKSDDCSNGSSKSDDCGNGSNNDKQVAWAVTYLSAA